MKKAVSGIVLMLLLTSMLSSAFITQPVKAEWSGTVYIRADGSIDPADAPIITYDNVTYTLTDNIRSSADGIVVERDNIVIDGDGYTLQGAGSGKGVDLSGRTNVTVWNTQIKNFDDGILLVHSSNNSIYHNNFVDNTYQISNDGSVNVWDDGYPSGGNYWSDYSAVDLFGGPYQNVTGSDGVGDTPYVIDEYNVDRYPLMAPYTIIPPVPSVINATIDINPKALDLRSRGGWITAYIELPEGYDVNDIYVSSILLNDTISARSELIAIGDFDNDTVPDLMVCFNWTDVTDYILSKGIAYGNVTLTISGRLHDGTVFVGSDIILVSSLLGDVNVDGKVDIRDLSIAALAFGETPERPRWNPQADINGDNYIDIRDIVLIAKNFGKHA